MLQCGGRAVGAILLIASQDPAHGGAVRVNVSSWFVADEYRAYAPLLVLRAIAAKPATYVNVSPAAHTRAIIEAQGFQKAGEGVFAAVPAMAWRRRAAKLATNPREWEASESIDAQSFQLLMDHHRFGCIGVWLETESGAGPFILRERRLRSGNTRCAQLVYAPSLADLERSIAALGEALARRRLLLMLTGATRPLRGVPGRYFPAKMPIYAKGPEPQTSQNLAYTEAALLGF